MLDPTKWVSLSGYHMVLVFVFLTSLSVIISSCISVFNIK